MAVSLLALATTACNAADDTTAGDRAGAAMISGQEAAGPWPSLHSAVPADPIIESRVNGILEIMSLEQKVGQVIQAEIQSISPEDVRDYHIGSILNGGGSYPGKNKQASAADWVAMADAYYEASMDTEEGRLAIPVLWGTDAVHGHNNVHGATIFPHNIGLGAAHDAELMRQIGAATAIEVSVTGIPWTFAPTLAVAQDLRWGRSYESYSGDPNLVRQYAEAMVSGLQGKPGSETFLDGDHVLATAKHFLGDGGTTHGTDQGDTEISEQELFDTHAQGYLGALAAGVQTVMASFSSWNGDKMHGNRYLLTEVLKGRMGFDGLVVGDWNGHAQVPGCENASCPAAFNAGVDLFMVPEDWKALWHNMQQQVRSNEIPMARLDDAVRRILRVKMRAGLFDKGPPSSWPHAGRAELLGAPEHRAVARRAVRESLVLLKNEAQTLPLNPAAKVLVAGAGADDIGMQSGGWTLSWQGRDNQNSDFPGATSIWSGIEAAVSAAGGEAVLSTDGSFEQTPDAAIVVFGEQPYAEMEGDLQDLAYRDEEQRDLALLTRLRGAGIPVVAVFLSGRPLVVDAYMEAADAFVAAWLPGSEGAGVADVLFAAADGAIQHDFTGRLPFAWPGAGGSKFAAGHGLSVRGE